MALKTFITADAHAELPKAQRDWYRQTEGGAYVLDAEGCDDAFLRDPLGSYARAKDELRAARGGGGGGLTPAEQQAAVERIKTEHAVEIAQMDAEHTALRAAVDEVALDSACGAAIRAYGGDPALLVPIVRPLLRVEHDALGRSHVLVIGADGGPRFNRQGGLMSPAELVAGMRESESLRQAFAPTITTDARRGIGAGIVEQFRHYVNGRNNN